MTRIGIDFGGTKIEAAALDRDGNFLARIRRPNPGDYDAAIAVVRDLVAAVEAEAEAGPGASIGIGTPGSISPRDGLIRNSNSRYLNGRPFREDLAAALGRPLRMANDANCLALSEAREGAGAGAPSLFAAILGTGCGGGIVIEGRIVGGGFGNAGEWGHVPLPWPDRVELPAPACWCGQAGCLEMWISGSGLARDHAVRVGGDLDAAAIVRRAEAGDPDAAASLAAYADRLGRALAMIVNIVDPDMIVLGGGMSNVASLYDSVPPRIGAHIFGGNDWAGRLLPARFGDSSGVRGAAFLWDDGAERVSGG